MYHWTECKPLKMNYTSTLVLIVFYIFFCICAYLIVDGILSAFNMNDMSAIYFLSGVLAS